MKLFIEKLLKGFQYDNILEFGQSLLPSSKYQITIPTFFLSMTFGGIEQAIEILYGLDGLGFGALTAVFFLELFSGIAASLMKKEPITSERFSRFTLKTACYLILIAIPYVLGQNFTKVHKNTPAWIFDTLNVVLLLHIVQENIVSILENLAVISGKEKTSWITAITGIFKNKGLNNET